MDVAPKDCFLQSLGRCSSDENFIPAFYERFLATSDEIRNKFRNTDFDKQNEMLLLSLKLSAEATFGNAEALREIHERAKTHDSCHLNIEPRMYDLWLTSVIAVAKEFDPQWDDSIEKAWNTILGHVIKLMVKHY